MRKSPYADTCNKATDRLKAAEQIAKALREAGAEVTITNPSLWGLRCISVQMEVDGYKMFTDLEGGSKVHSFLTHWHGDKVLPKTFGTTIRGSRNEYHGRKATGVYETLDEMIKATICGVQSLKQKTEEKGIVEDAKG